MLIRGIAELASDSQNGGGIIVGKQWVMMDLVPLEAFIGGGYMAGEPQVIGQDGQPREEP